MKDLRMNEDGDIYFRNGRFEYVEGIELIQQNIRRRLKTFKNTWFLNSDLGMPYFEEILDKNRDLNRIKEIFIKEISKIKSVKRVLDLSLELDKVTRVLSASITILTEYSETFTDIIEI